MSTTTDAAAQEKATAIRIAAAQHFEGCLNGIQLTRALTQIAHQHWTPYSDVRAQFDQELAHLSAGSPRR